MRVAEWGSVRLALIFGLLSSAAHAEVSVRRLHEAGADAHLRWSARSPSGERVELLARVPDRNVAAELGLAWLAGAGSVGSGASGGWATYRGAPSDLWPLLGRRDIDWVFSPARHLQMDVAGPAIGATQARVEVGVDGTGVVVGVVDTGLDFRHPAFLNPDGTTRVSWLLSFGQSPRGVHTALEDDVGCTRFDDCAVFSGADIDAIVQSGLLAELPVDSIGHGTHVASIAAGSDPFYTGIAPGAELVIVQAAGEAGSASDAGILEGVRFIFDRATELGLPAVVNLSLGSPFGAHDGSSSLERALTDLSRGPGRVVVVAAGNDGWIVEQGDARHPDPLGIHAEAIVPEGSEVRVPLVFSPLSEADVLDGSVFIWISSTPGDELTIAVDNGKGRVTERLGVGQTGVSTSQDLGDPDDYQLVVLNGDDEDLDWGVGPQSIVVGLSGTFRADRKFELVLGGHGTARLWAEGGGDLDGGVLVPRARVGGTVAVPATAEGVVSVGATVNRSSWVDYEGDAIELFGANPGTRASFSAAGPDQNGHLEPDVLAPGHFVIAAMAEAADPRAQAGSVSQFANVGQCPSPLSECLVVDDRHAVGSGTSMATPVVTGAVALLLQRDASLDVTSVRRLLRASASPPLLGRALVGDGAGVVDVRALLLVQDAEVSGVVRSPNSASSRLILADAFLRPGAEHALEGLVLLRDAAGDAAGGFDAERLTIEVLGPAEAEMTAVHAGLAEFRLRAKAGSGEQKASVRVLFDGQLLVEEILPIAVDSAVYRGGFRIEGGTCALASPALVSKAGVPGGTVVALGGLAALVVLSGWRRRAKGAPSRRATARAD